MPLYYLAQAVLQFKSALFKTEFTAKGPGFTAGD
jgi:hypothetical protein